MILAVLDYAAGTVDIISDVPNMERNDEIESYLIADLNYNPDEISWMIIKTTDDVVFLTTKDFG